MLLHQMGSRLTSMCCGVAWVQLADAAGFQAAPCRSCSSTRRPATGLKPRRDGLVLGPADCDALKATMTAGCPEKPWYAYDAGYKADFQKDVNDGAQRWEPGPITDAYRKYDHDRRADVHPRVRSNSTIKGACKDNENSALCARKRRATRVQEGDLHWIELQRRPDTRRG